MLKKLLLLGVFLSCVKATENEIVEIRRIKTDEERTALLKKFEDKTDTIEDWLTFFVTLIEYRQYSDKIDQLYCHPSFEYEIRNIKARIFNKYFVYRKNKDSLSCSNKLSEIMLNLSETCKVNLYNVINETESSINFDECWYRYRRFDDGSSEVQHNHKLYEKGFLNFFNIINDVSMRENLENLIQKMYDKLTPTEFKGRSVSQPDLKSILEEIKNINFTNQLDPWVIEADKVKESMEYKFPIYSVLPQTEQVDSLSVTQKLSNKKQQNKEVIKPTTKNHSNNNQNLITAQHQSNNKKNIIIGGIITATILAGIAYYFYISK